MATSKNPISELWQNMSRARRTMSVAIVVLFVSQFFTYSEYRGYGVLSVDSDYNTHGTYWPDLDPVGTGWEIHPYALLILPFLAFIYVSSMCERPFWRNWGYLISVCLVYVCLIYGQWEMTGLKLGLFAFCLAVWAAVQNRKDRKAAAAATRA